MGFHRVTKRAAALLLAAAFVLGACTRSASTPPAATEGGDDSSSGLTSQQMTMEAVRSDLLTQTAQAADAGEPEATETPEPTEASQATEPAEATSAPAATAVVGVPASYTLQAGEHPYCIARRFDIEPNALLTANGLDQSSLIPPGLTLTIPSGSAGFPPPRALRTHPDNYTVQSGETIYSIACLYGDVDPIAIANANGLTEPYAISAGTSISIP